MYRTNSPERNEALALIDYMEIQASTLSNLIKNSKCMKLVDVSAITTALSTTAGAIEMCKDLKDSKCQ